MPAVISGSEAARHADRLSSRGSPAPSSSRPALRSACETCRHRKIKCTGERPICARCERLKKNCVYSSPIRSNESDEKAKQARRIANLEAEIRRLEAAARTANVSYNDSSLATTQVPPPHASPSDARSNSSPRATTSQARIVIPADPPRNPSSTPESTQELRVTLGYPKPHNRPLPSNNQLMYQLSSGFDVSTIVKKVPPREAHAQIPVQIDTNALPPQQTIHDLLHHFMTYTCAAFPMFHLPTLSSLVDSVCFQQNMVEAEEVCAVILVLAVAATSMPDTSTVYDMKAMARGLWEYGQKFLPPVFLPPIDETRGLLRIQVMLIRLQYVLYNPNAGNVWGLSGAAVRASVDLGFHHEWRGRDRSMISQVELDLRRRVFWISYSIDRDLCMALGRPPAISDEWISTEFPSDRDDTLILPSQILDGPPSPIKLTTIHLIHIRKLQSDIHSKLYIPSRTQNPPSVEWFKSMEETLKIWKNTAPAGTGFCSNEWLDLSYHMTLTLLHRPSPGNPSPPRDALKKALDGSATTMRVYKDMYRAGRINFNWLSMYHLFMAGVTYLNSLWQAHRNGWAIVPSYVGALLDIHVCSSVMEALAAITPGTSAIRDTFETVSERIIRQLSSNARWDALSRPPSPGLTSYDGNRQVGRQGDLDTTLWSSGNEFDASGSGSGIDPILGIANPFDSFLLHPLGEMSGDDWGRALASVLEYPIEDDPFGTGSRQ